MALLLDDLQTSAGRISSDIGEARVFTEKVLDLSLDRFSDEQVDRLEGLIEGAIEALSKNLSEEAPFLVIKLTEALRGIRHGLPPDPTRRPSRETLAAGFEDDLRTAAS